MVTCEVSGPVPETSLYWAEERKVYVGGGWCLAGGTAAAILRGASRGRSRQAFAQARHKECTSPVKPIKSVPTVNFFVLDLKVNM